MTNRLAMEPYDLNVVACRSPRSQAACVQAAVFSEKSGYIGITPHAPRPHRLWYTSVNFGRRFGFSYSPA